MSPLTSKRRAASAAPQRRTSAERARTTRTRTYRSVLSEHFGVWPLSEAAEACFGTPQWPAARAVPQASIEFEVEDAEAVAAAGGELQRAGFELLHPAPPEPGGA